MQTWWHKVALGGTVPKSYSAPTNVGASTAPTMAAAPTKQIKATITMRTMINTATI
jgi:hypothetical protein